MAYLVTSITHCGRHSRRRHCQYYYRYAGYVSQLRVWENQK